MTPGSHTAEEVFAGLVGALADEPGVVRPAPADGGPRGFGASALRVNDRIFAMVSHGRLVFKLPAQRVAELIGTGRGDPFDAGKGRPMKEWVGLEPNADEDWLNLATEALAFGRTLR